MQFQNRQSSIIASHTVLLTIWQSKNECKHNIIISVSAIMTWVQSNFLCQSWAPTWWFSPSSEFIF